jgi:hypothetical protein
MDVIESAKRIICQVLAVTLGVTAQTIEKLLPYRPEWLEKIHLLAAQIRPVAYADDDGGTAPVGGTGAAPEGFVDGERDRLLAAYACLWDYVQTLKVAGLNLDDTFYERAEREWSVSVLAAYFQSSEKALKTGAARAQGEAAGILAFTAEDDVERDAA